MPIERVQRIRPGHVVDVAAGDELDVTIDEGGVAAAAGVGEGVLVRVVGVAGVAVVDNAEQIVALHDVGRSVIQRVGVLLED